MGKGESLQRFLKLIPSQEDKSVLLDFKSGFSGPRVHSTGKISDSIEEQRTQPMKNRYFISIQRREIQLFLRSNQTRIQKILFFFFACILVWRLQTRSIYKLSLQALFWSLKCGESGFTISTEKESQICAWFLVYKLERFWPYQQVILLL